MPLLTRDAQICELCSTLIPAKSPATPLKCENEGFIQYIPITYIHLVYKKI